MPLFKVIYTGQNALRTESGDVVKPYEPFLASPKWLMKRLPQLHRTPSVEEYRDRLLGMTPDALRKHARSRDISERGERPALIAALLADILPMAPDEVPPPGEVYIDNVIISGAPDWATITPTYVRQEARRRGLDGMAPIAKLRRILAGEEDATDEAPPAQPPADAQRGSDEDGEDEEDSGRDPDEVAPARPELDPSRPAEWRAQLAAAHAAEDYRAASRLLKRLGLTPENGSKKAVLASAAQYLAQKEG